MLRYLRGHLQDYGRPFAGDEWGAFTVYLEVDDQHVVRQINVYETGQVLRYDRSHWCDEFGMMFIGRFSRKQKGARGYEVIGQKDFEKNWQRASRSSLWHQQVASRRTDWGTWAERVNV